MKGLTLLVALVIATSGCLGGAASSDGETREVQTTEHYVIMSCTHMRGDGEGNVVFNGPGCSVKIGNVASDDPYAEWILDDITTGFAFLINGSSHANLRSMLTVTSVNETGVKHHIEAEMFMGKRQETHNPFSWYAKETQDLVWFSACGRQTLTVDYEPGTPYDDVEITVFAFQPDPLVAEQAQAAATCDGYWG